MNKMKKALLMTLCAGCLIVTTVFGTLAYLTDTDSNVNTFTVGTVGIWLDELDVDKDTDSSDITPGINDEDQRDKKNTYHLLPGHTYIKDPTVTVEAGSEESYVRMLVTLNYATELKEIFGDNFLPQNYVSGWDNTVWQTTGTVKEDATANTLIYEFRYVGEDYKGTKNGTVCKTEADIKLDALFDSFKLPGEVTKEQLATLVTKNNAGKITDQFTITVVAHAIQADGFDNAEAAWEAFDEQISNQ